MSTINLINAVTTIPAADSVTALAHFEVSLQFETDCADVAGALISGTPGFVLLDVRSPALFARGHVPGAVNLPLGKIVASRLMDYSPDTLFVTYCAGPHCNGATRGAIRLAQCKHPAISSGFLFFGVRAYVSTIRKRTRAHYFPRHSDRAHTAHLQHLV
jgi:rhodanese-related sulfurtransferase